LHDDNGRLSVHRIRGAEETIVEVREKSERIKMRTMLVKTSITESGDEAVGTRGWLRRGEMSYRHSLRTQARGESDEHNDENQPAHD
jgi:hypothetical protein